MRWIITENPDRDCWERLLEYTNQDVATERISTVHGPASERQRANYSKQAKQVRACLLQAKEYFDATRSSSIVTAPNHLYYGACSLFSAAMLINGSGEKSLDFLRKDPRNRRHGLALDFEFTQCNPSAGVALLDKAKSTIESHGFLAQAYQAIPSSLPAHSLLTAYDNQGRYTYALTVSGSESRPILQVSAKYSALDLCRRLPDLEENFRHLGLRRDVVRCSTSVTHRNHKVEHRFIIHEPASQETEDALMELFKFHCNTLSEEHYQTINVARFPGGGWMVKIPSNGHTLRFECPSIRWSLTGEEYMLASPSESWEWLDAFITSYILSMLSRYFPDIWMNCLESRCGSAAIAQRFVTAYTRKFPQLALELMSGSRTVFTVRSPPAPS